MAKSWVPIASGGLFALSMGIALPISETRPATGPHAGQKGEKSLGAVRARVVPETPILERDRLGQYLNWDFRIGNDTGERIALTRIEFSVLDSAGRLALRRFLSAEGAVRPGIETVPRREIDAGAETDLFNPFHTIDPALPAETLRFKLEFQGRQSYSTEISVRPAPYRSRAELTLPLKDRFIVYDGHDYYSHHRRLDLSHPRIKRLGMSHSPVRYAYDFSSIDENGALYRPDPSRPENWLAYNAAVHAPAPGRVVSAANDVADNRYEDGRVVPASEPADVLSAALGNHVVIDHGKGEYSVLAHLKAGSVTVKRDESVKRDQLLGRIGFSGDTGMHVHLHYHLATGPGIDANGLPSYFREYRRILGSSVVRVRDGLLHTGDIIQGR
jgi:Peptidase family M23